MKTILFLEWNSYGNGYMQEAWRESGFDVECYALHRERMEGKENEQLAVELVEQMMSKPYEFVFSFNYFPTVAMACKACQIKYISWVYDSPLIALYSQTIAFSTNYIFVFDKMVYLSLREQGAERVFYLPLAAAVKQYDKVQPTTEGVKRYDADVTFVGSMYTEQKNNMFRHLKGLDEYTRGYLEAVIEGQKRIYGYNFLEKVLTEDIMNHVSSVCPISEQPDGFETKEWTFANYFLARRVTAIERMDILNLLSEKHKVKLFTKEATPTLPKVENMGEADYYNTMPEILKCGRIQLNITLRSILSGIPLRAFDIMGCGGFLLTNYQEDFLDYFVPEEDFVYYESYEDLERKADFYLEHEDVRQQIAQNGYEKVKENHTYQKRVAEILNVIS